METEFSVIDRDKKAVLEERAELHQANFITFDGLDDALLGTTDNGGEWRTVYSQDGIINILMERDGMTRFDAYEYFHFNIESLHVGDNTPLIMEDI